MPWKSGVWGIEARSRSRKRLEYFRKYAQYRPISKNYYLLRQAVLNKFQRKCNYCFFSDIRALQIDHVNNDGIKDTRLKKGGAYFLALVLKDKENQYQLLCANCNIIKKFENQTRKRGELKMDENQTPVEETTETPVEETPVEEPTTPEAETTTEEATE